MTAIGKYFDEDTELKRDGKPHKYVVLSFDDGITQDRKMIEIMKKYDIKASFNLNTGLFGVSWDWVCEVQGRGKKFPHLRFTEEELKTGIYDGMDICSHGSLHAACDNQSAENIINEVKTDAEKIEKIYGKYPRGFAYPGGTYDEHAAQVIIENTDIRYARTIKDTGKYDLPEYFMEWHPTCNVMANGLTPFAKFLKAELGEEDMLFYGWGHSYELDINDSWKAFEALMKKIGEARDECEIILLTDAEFYELFKDEIPSWKTEK